MEKPSDFILWAYGQALRLSVSTVPSAPARVVQDNIAPRPPTIVELAGLGFGRRKPRG